MGIAALVLGLLGVIFSFVPMLFVFTVPGSLAAIVLAIFGIRSARKHQRPKGAAVAGLVLGILGALIGLAMYAACVACHRAAGEGGAYQLTHTCWSNGDCREWTNGRRPICHHERCVECRDDRDCGKNPNGARCDFVEGQCNP